MAEQPTAVTTRNPGNPYAGPSLDLGDDWGDDDSAPATIRHANRSDEACLKALVRWNIVVAVLVASMACFYLSYLVRHALGQINAPWVFKWNYLAYDAFLIIAPVLGVIGAVGLDRRKPWAMRVQIVLVMDLLLAWVLPLINRNSSPPLEVYLQGWIFTLCLTLPFLNLVDLRKSVVLGPDYLRVLDKTSYIRVEAKLPLWQRLLVAALVILFIGIGSMNQT